MLLIIKTVAAKADISAWRDVCIDHFHNGDRFKEEIKLKLSFLYLQDLLKVIYNGRYSFSISHFVLELFRFV